MLFGVEHFTGFLKCSMCKEMGVADIARWAKEMVEDCEGMGKAWVAGQECRKHGQFGDRGVRDKDNKAWT